MGDVADDTIGEAGQDRGLALSSPVVKEWIRSSTTFEDILSAAFERSSTGQAVALSPASIAGMELYMLQKMRPALKRQLKAAAMTEQAGSGDDPGRVLRTLTRRQARVAFSSPGFAKELQRRRALCLFGLDMENLAAEGTDVSATEVDPAYQPEDLPPGTLVVSARPSG